ncbi:MAG: glutamate--tRNA ligase, partial [Phenylobacterium sp.]
MSNRPVRTRIAPSPTGMMHIGTARTALFNFLYAKHTGGKFLLRIEDTDRERSTEANVEVIFEGMKWLGLDPDETPVFQFARAARHREAAEAMLATGRAYKDYMTPEELESERELARAEGRVVRSPWRDLAPNDAADRPFVVRLKAPLDGETVIQDAVKGEVRFQNRQLDDLILLRTDGTPTYNLAVVVDDHEMEITHVIRGDDHLNNAARQTLIYQALGWEVPVWAHLPLIHGPDGAKLSKRHGAQAVSEFDEMGYLPETMRNYLARLGWGHGDDEIFSDAQAAAWFDIKDVVSAPARLDWDKLNHLNHHYIRQADPARLAGLAARHIDGVRPDDLKRIAHTIP